MIEKTGQPVFTDKKGSFGEYHGTGTAKLARSSIIGLPDVTIRPAPGLCIVAKMITTKKQPK
jgi:hypothetical protein